MPWICAYTGARVNEVTQLWPSDISVKKGVNVARFDADATKTGDYREVPLHDDLIDQGLLKYVARRSYPGCNPSGSMLPSASSDGSNSELNGVLSMNYSLNIWIFGIRSAMKGD